MLPPGTKKTVWFMDRGQKKEYKVEDRDNYWWFKFGGIAFRIPKPFEVGAIATLAERGLETAIEDEMTGARFAERFGHIMKDNLAMNPVPQAIKPLIDLYANKDSFRGRPIETMGMERLEPTQRYTQQTSTVARGLSEATFGALSPVQYDHLIKAYFGWLGAFVVGGADVVTRPMTGAPTRPAIDTWKFATQGFLTELPSPQSRYVSAIYDQAKEVEEAYATYKDMVAQGRREDAAEYLDSNRELIGRRGAISRAKEAMTLANKQIKMIERSDLDPTIKRERIEAIQARKDRIAKAAYQP